MASHLPDSNAGYLDSTYWDNRFHDEQQYDWFKGFAQFSHLVMPHLQPSNHVLVVGCGNSSLTQDLYTCGVQHLTSTDLSSVVIEQMRARAAAAHQDGIIWQVWRH